MDSTRTVMVGGGGDGQYNFTKEGWLVYEPGQVAHPSIYEPFWWEVFDWRPVFTGIDRSKHYPLIISGIYVVLVFGLQSFMKKRKPFVLKRELALWNGMLGLFSILGFARVFPDFLRTFGERGLHRTLCEKEVISVPMTFWATAFLISKVVELGDTVFIVLRKRPVQFLQWYHHAVTLTLVWTVFGFMEPIDKIFALMNFGVHSLMYPYFMARAMDIHIPIALANIITFLQLVQMVVGFAANAYTSYFYYFVGPCHRHPFSIAMCWLVYGTFLILFGELFHRLVVKKIKANRKSE